MKPFTANEKTTITTGRVKMDRHQAFPRTGHLVPVPGSPDTYNIRDFIVLLPGERVRIHPLPETDEPKQAKPKKKAAKK